MKLTYFVGPYDLLNHKTLRPTPMTIEGMLSQISYSLYLNAFVLGTSSIGWFSIFQQFNTIREKIFNNIP